MNILNKDNEGMPLDFPPQLLCFLPSAVHRAEDFKMFCNAIVKLSRRRKLFELSPQSLGASCDRCFDRSIGAMVVMWETQCHKPTIWGCFIHFYTTHLCINGGFSTPLNIFGGIIPRYP